MACDISALLAADSELLGLTTEQLEIAQLSVLASIVLTLDPGADVTPNGLMQQAACLQCLTTQQREMLEIALLCQLTGGGTGGPGVMEVENTAALEAVGPPGGPFVDSSIDYTITNTGGSAINWTATKSENWTTLSSSGGTLLPGHSYILNVSLNSNANSLPASPDTYFDSLVITNTTNGDGNTARELGVTVE